MSLAGAARRTGKAWSHKPVMNEMGKSDEPIVPVKRQNNAARVVAEAVEGRGEAKGNAAKRNADRTQSRSNPAHNELDRVRSRARRDKKILGPTSDSTPRPEVGAQCGNSARWDLCGGRPQPETAKGRPYRDRRLYPKGGRGVDLIQINFPAPVLPPFDLARSIPAVFFGCTAHLFVVP
jgi:hypothetical protein